MEFSGDAVLALVSLAQETGIVLGMGALTVTLIGHLLSLQAGLDESQLRYVRAARQVRAAALAIIIMCGIAGVLLHAQHGTLLGAMTPAFVFGSLMSLLLAAFYLLESDVRGLARDAVEGFEGANWYALFIVHNAAPIVGWHLLLTIYGAWLLVFAAIWAGFVWVMRHKAAPVPESAPIAVPVPPPAPSAASAPVPPAPGPSVPIPSITVMPKRPEDIQ